MNCAGNELQNIFCDYGVRYMTLFWLDDDRQQLFDDGDKIAQVIVGFVDEALDQLTCVLVHSVSGETRSCSLLIIYFMAKYRWSLIQTLDFVTLRRPNLRMRTSFIQ